MDELTIGVLSSAVWDLIKTGATVSANYLKEKLKDWILSDDELNTLADTINRASMDEIVSERALKEYLHSNEEIIKVISNSKPNVNIHQTTYDGDNYIIKDVEKIIINNFDKKETDALKTNNIDFNIFDKFNRFHSIKLLASFLSSREKCEVLNNSVSVNINIPENKKV